MFTAGSSRRRPTAARANLYAASFDQDHSTDSHPRAVFAQALDDLQSEVVAVASVVPEAMAAALAALMGADHELARSVRDGHRAVAEATVRCEARACEIMARQQPTAGDLRLVTTLVRLGHEVERSSKLVRHVAEFAARPTTAVRSPSGPGPAGSHGRRGLPALPRGHRRLRRA